MICQYCGHKLTDGKCLNPACPGRLRPTGESSNGATLGQDSTLLRPAPAKVERLVKHPLSLSTKPYKIQTVLRDLAAQENMEGDPYDQIQEASNYIDELEGYINYLLAAFSNTTPYLSQDVNVPVEKLEAGRYWMMIPVEISTTGGLLLDRRDGLHGYSLEDYPNARFFKVGE